MRTRVHSAVASAVAAATLILVSATTGLAQQSAVQLVAGVPNDRVLETLRVRSLGPAASSGRISDIAVAHDPDAPPGTRRGKVIYVASASGGVFKSENGGVNWRPIFDDVGVPSVGAVAVAPSDPDVVWVGTGEANNLRSSSWGRGVFRSTDAGESWEFMGLATSQHVGRIVIHPSDPQTVFVAAGGPLWAPGGERGFYKTTDGGRTWRNTLAAGESTGVTDIVLDPTDPNIVYASTFQRERRSYSFVAGGPESAIHKSTDGGETWTRLTEGLPTGDVGRIGLDVSRSNPQRVWAHIDAPNPDLGTYRSDDGGATWTQTSTRASGFPWFFGQIRVDPKDPDRIYHLGVQLEASPDGGETWVQVGQGTHADHHAMWIDPDDPEHMIIGNDGGLYVTQTGGGAGQWDFAVDLPLAQFYTVHADLREPFYYVYGGTQDNGSWAGPVQTRRSGGIGNADWARILGGDGFHVATDPVEPDIVYAESQNGNVRRLNLATGETRAIRPPGVPGSQARYNWSAPLLISPHDRMTLYFASQFLYRSRDRGDSWERLGEDMTRGLDRNLIPIMGYTEAGGFRRHASTAAFGNVSAIEESRIREGLLYVGTDDGVVQVSRDGGASWMRLDAFPGVPELAYVSRVVASAHHEGTVYVTFDHHRDNDFAPYVLRSTDYGETFTSIAGDLPVDEPVHVIREHHTNPQLLFVGTEFGLHFTIDGGASWHRIESGLPPAPVHDLVIQPRDNDLVIGTHGRGIFVLHDLAPLEQLARAGRAARGHVFPAADAWILSNRAGPNSTGHRGFSVPNPPAGAQVHYFIQADFPSAGQAELAVVDREGRLVRRLEVNRASGLHRVQWDLRHESPVLLARMEAGDDPPAAPGFVEDEVADPEAPWVWQQQQQQPAPGHRVFPGEYRVQLRYTPPGGRTEVVSEAPVRVRPDPDLTLSDVEYRELHRWRTMASDLLFDAQLVVERTEAARAGFGDAQDLPAPLQEVSDEMEGLLQRIRGGGEQGSGSGQPIMQRVSSVLGDIGLGHFPPTPAHRAALADARTELEVTAAQLSGVVERAAALAERRGAAAGG